MKKTITLLVSLIIFSPCVHAQDDLTENEFIRAMQCLSTSTQYTVQTKDDKTVAYYSPRYRGMITPSEILKMYCNIETIIQIINASHSNSDLRQMKKKIAALTFTGTVSSENISNARALVAVFKEAYKECDKWTWYKSRMNYDTSKNIMKYW